MVRPVCLSSCRSVSLSLYMYMYMYTYTCICICIFTCLCICICICIYRCRCRCVYVYIYYTYTCMLFMYTYIYIHICYPCIYTYTKYIVYIKTQMYTCDCTVLGSFGGTGARNSGFRGGLRSSALRDGRSKPPQRSLAPDSSQSEVPTAAIQGISYGPWYVPIPSLKGSELWAPILNVVYGFIRLQNYGPILGDQGIYFGC